MTKRPPLLVGSLLLLCGVFEGCGHRGDPLPPLRKTPPAPTAFRLAQRGEAIELQASAPAASIDGVAYQAVAVEFLHAGERIDLEKKGRRVLVPAAGGAPAVTTLPLPAPGTWVRAAARAVVGGERGPRTLTAALVAHAPLEAPTQLEARLIESGIELRWRGPRPEPIAPPVLPNLPFANKPPATAPGAGRAPTGTGTKPPAPTAATPESAGPDRPGTPASPAQTPPAPTATTLDPAGKPSAPGVAPANADQAAPAPAVTTVTPPAPAAPRRSGFFLYRRGADEPYRAPLVVEPTDRHLFVDPSAAEGAKVCYVIRAVGSTEPLIESAASNEVCSERRDVTAPEPPAGLAALPRAAAIELLWSPSKEEDLASYRVYRALGAEAPARLAELALGKASYLDADVKPGVVYRYTLTAVDRSGNESAPSEAVEASLP